VAAGRAQVSMRGSVRGESACQASRETGAARVPAEVSRLSMYMLTAHSLQQQQQQQHRRGIRGGRERREQSRNPVHGRAGGWGACVGVLRMLVVVVRFDVDTPINMGVVWVLPVLGGVAREPQKSEADSWGRWVH
jgi:hypothetical protein